MYTKFEELELLELFWSEPVTTEEQMMAGEFVYRRKINEFELSIFLDVYNYAVIVALDVFDYDVFNTKMGNITELKKNGNDLEFYSKNKLKLIITFEDAKFISIELPDEETDFSWVVDN